MLTQLIAVIGKEVRQTARDRRMMFLILGAPLLQLVLFGYAVNLDVDAVPTVVVDHDGSSTSRRHVQRILADGTLREVGSTRDERRAAQAIERGEAAVMLVFPVGFARDLARGRATEVQALVDGTDPNRTGVAVGAVSGYFASAAAGEGARLPRAQGVARGEPRRVPGVDVVHRVFYNPRLQTAIFMVPGVASILLMLITTIVTAMGIAREREAGTLEQVLVTPLPSGVIIAGKLLPFLVVGVIDFALAMAAGVWLFDMPIRGSLPLILASTLLYLLTTLGTGLFISAISRSQQQAFMAGFAFILPSMLLSGTLTPVHSMPGWMQRATLLNPSRFYVEALRRALLEGATVGDLWGHLLAMALFGVAILFFATRRFRKTLA